MFVKEIPSNSHYSYYTTLVTETISFPNAEYAHENELYVYDSYFRKRKESESVNFRFDKVGSINNDTG